MKQAISRRRFMRYAASLGLGGALVACAPKVVEKEVVKEVTVPVKETVQTVATLAPGQKKELLIHWRTSENEINFLRSMFERFKEEHPEVEFKESYTSWEEYDRKADLLIAAGTPPCVWGPMAQRGGRYYAARNLFMVLDPFVEKDNYDTSDFYPGTLQLCKWDDHWVGLPMDLWPSFFVYNKTLFDKEGVPHPSADWNDKTWSWDQVAAIGSTLTKRTGDQNTQFALSAAWPDRMAFRHFGLSYFAKADFDRGYPQQFAGNTSEFLDALRYMYRTVSEWGIAPTPAQTQALQAGAPNLFMTGKLGMALDFMWNFGAYKDIQDFEWGVAVVPHPTFLGHSLGRFNFMFPDQWFIMRGCLAPDVAWEFLKLLASPEGLLAFGKATGAMPARKSVAEGEWAQGTKEKYKVTDEVMKVIFGGADIQTASESHAFVAFEELYTKGVQPSFEAVFVGQLSPEAAVQQMEAEVNRIIAETNPKA